MKLRYSALVLGLAAVLSAPALAADASDGVTHFTQADFSGASGVLLTQVPAESQGRLMLEGRVLRAGDAVTGDQLSLMTFVSGGEEAGEAALSCLGLTDGGPEALELTLRTGKDQPPVAEDSQFKTYKNIPGQVPLTVSDPEGGPLTVTIVTPPRRGTCEIAADGAVTYTPEENKVGKDSFTYTVTDAAGNVSEEATVRIEIQKPSDKQTYGDMDGDPALLAATWLREERVYSGYTVGEQLLFGPEETVSRGEFIAMCASLTGLTDEALSTGFLDEETTPDWLRPYISTALRCGYLSGLPTSGGLALDPDSPITQAQAVKLVGSMLGLTQSDSAAVAALEDGIPAWAAGPAAAMAAEDLYTVTDPDASLTRRDAALLLYRASLYGDSGEDSLLAWAAK